MAKDTQTIKCVIFTLRKENVIVPNALVAEIISVKDIQAAKNVPEWYLGNLTWRGLNVPLLSFEAAAGDEVLSVNLNTQAVVLYGVGADGVADENPYLALVMSGVPHVSNFSREQIKSDGEETEEHPMISQKVRINGARVSVLDVDSMVDMLSNVDVAA